MSLFEARAKPAVETRAESKALVEEARSPG